MRAWATADNLIVHQLCFDEVCPDHIWAFIQNVLSACPWGIDKKAGKVVLGGTSQKGC